VPAVAQAFAEIWEKSRVFKAVVTFERDGGEPVVVRLTIDDSAPDSAARKAVFRALPEAGRLKWESVVIVLDRSDGL
jgi:hypothetical protein